jgi:dynein heavy chain
MSPVGDLLRNRCRKFPSLINCCTLKWFQPWPQEALVSVAQQFLERINEETLSKEQKESMTNLFPIIHKSVERAADQFFVELRRKTYVTPKSYLDSIQLY